MSAYGNVTSNVNAREHIANHDDPSTNDAGSRQSNNCDDGEGDLIVDPLLKYFTEPPQHGHHQNNNFFNVDEAIEALKTEGYYHVPSVLTDDECKDALDHIWDFVEDVSGGCVHRSDPLSWYPQHEVFTTGEKKSKDPVVEQRGKIPIISNDPDKHYDLDPWPHTGYSSFPDMFQSLGAGYVLGDVRQHLAERIFEPLFGTRELLCSKEGFTFCRPLVVGLDNTVGWRDRKCQQATKADSCNGDLVWKPNHLSTRTANWTYVHPSNEVGHNDKRSVQKARPLFRVCGQPQPLSEGQHYDQGVPACAMQHIIDKTNQLAGTKGISKNQLKRNQRKQNKQQRFKDLAGLCHVQASVSFTDQTIDKHRGGGHFLCHPGSHSSVHWNLVGGTYRATLSHGANQKKEQPNPSWVPLTDEEIRKLDKMGCPEKRIYARKGDVILWRSDLVHTGVGPSLMMKKNSDDGADGATFGGPTEFRAVSYCSMLPVQAVKHYTMYSLPRQKLIKSRCKNWLPGEITNGSLSIVSEQAHRMLHCKEEKLTQQKLESYKTGRTGDHRPDVEDWHAHRRVTMWNTIHDNPRQKQSIPPRILQRPRFRLGAPALTVRQAELYGLLPYGESMKNAGCVEETQQIYIERAVIRGVRFVESVYRGRQMNGEDVGPWTIENGRFCLEGENAAIKKYVDDIPICLAKMEVLTPCSANGAPVGLSGQDKYLGGMASPCGRYIYGVPGHAKQVVRVGVNSGEIDFIGPKYVGEFKWLRGVEIPAPVMGTKDDGSLAYPSGCCLALPCNSQDGCVLKIDPETSRVSTFLTGSISNVEEGWLYHGGNLVDDGFVYAIPASAPRVMKINARAETTELIGPDYQGKAKWYGGITGADGNIYGIPHNATGVLKINPNTQEVTILAEGTLPEGLWKWHGGLASLDGSKIIGFPNNADSVLVIDVIKQQVYTVGDSSMLRSGYHRVPQDGRYKYLGGSLTADGKLAYLFPCDAEYVLRFNMVTDELKLVGPHLTEGENKFQNGFVGGDGCIYGIPQRSSGVLRIIPRGVKRYRRDGSALPADDEYVDMIYCGDDMASCKDKFEGGVLGFDGKIYCIPLRAKAFVNIIPGPSIEI